MLVMRWDWFSMGLESGPHSVPLVIWGACLYVLGQAAPLSSGLRGSMTFTNMWVTPWTKTSLKLQHVSVSCDWLLVGLDPTRVPKTFGEPISPYWGLKLPRLLAYAAPWSSLLCE